MYERCPVCDEARIRPFFSMDRVPVFANRLYDSREEALATPKGDVELGWCGGCGHVLNLAFEPQLVEYGVGYDNTQCHSGRFRGYLRGLAADLRRRHGLVGKTVVEIGCGAGDFLRLLCREARNRGIGFDPSYGGETTPEGGRVVIIPEEYAAEHGRIAADLICCRHTLEHLPQPMELLRTLRRSLGRASSTAIYFEVPNVRHTLRGDGPWDVVYEHCGYFGRESLERAMSRAGFHVLDVHEAFDGQFLAAHAVPADSGSPGVVWSLDELEQDADAFATRFDEAREMWRHRLGEMASLGVDVAVWGAGTKGVMFLNVLGGEAVGRAVDVNPLKQGGWIPGTGQPIVSPEALREAPPDVVIAMNPAYEQEIKRTLRDLGLQSKVLCA